MLNINQLKKELNQVTIIKRIDKKEFINDLKAIPTPFVEIQFTKDSNQILIIQPRGMKYICHISKD